MVFLGIEALPSMRLKEGCGMPVLRATADTTSPLAGEAWFGDRDRSGGALCADGKAQAHTIRISA